jgi:hypothetical protein
VDVDAGLSDIMKIAPRHMAMPRRARLPWPHSPSLAAGKD